MNAPPAVIDAPAGTDPAPSSNENVNEFAGASASEAVAVNDTNTPSSPDWGPTGSNAGATFTSLTVTVIVSRSSRFGVPSSVTTTSNV